MDTSALEEVVDGMQHDIGCNAWVDADLPCKCRLSERRVEARAELAALRLRAEDAELILRRALNSDDREGYWITHNGTDCTLYVGEEEDGEPITADLVMKDGLPVLTAEVREMLRKEMR